MLQRGQDIDIEDLEEYSRAEFRTVIDAMLADGHWDVYRIWYKRPHLDYPANVGVGPGRDAREGLSAFLANHSEAKDGTYYVCDGPGDTPRVANPFDGFCFEVKDGRIIYFEYG